MPRRLHLTLIGAIELRRSDGEAVTFPMRKCQALLALLALSPAGTLSRERCAALLWSRSAEAQARASLRQCVLATHRSLGADASVLLGSRDALTLVPDAHETDLAILESLESAHASSPEPDALQALHGTLFGDFGLNEAPFEDWQRQERSRFAHRLSRALNAASQRWRETGALPAALDAARIAVEADPLNEASVRELMRSYAALGSVAQALNTFSEHCRLLRAELGSDPSAQTASLASGLRRQGEALEAAAAPAQENSRLPTLRIDAIQTGAGSALAAELGLDLHDALIFRAARRRGIRLVDQSGESSTPVDYALRGRISLRQQTARVTMRLIREANAEDIWVEQIEGDIDSHFELVDRICARVDAAVRLWTNAFDAKRIANVSDAELAPAQILTRAAGCLYKATVDGHREALRLVESVRQAEPDNAMARAMRVEIETMLFASGTPRPDETLSHEQALALVEEAIAIDPMSDYAFSIRALLKTVALEDPSGALADADRALELVPGFVWGLLTQAQAHLALGDAEMALPPLEEVLRVSAEDPYLPLYLHTYCRAALLAKSFTRAETAARSCVSRLPDVVPFQRLHAVCLGALEGPDAAAPALALAESSGTDVHLLAIHIPLHPHDARHRAQLLKDVGLDPSEEQTRFIL